MGRGCVFRSVTVLAVKVILNYSLLLYWMKNNLVEYHAILQNQCYVFLLFSPFPKANCLQNTEVPSTNIYVCFI